MSLSKASKHSKKTELIMLIAKKRAMRGESFRELHSLRRYSITELKELYKRENPE